MLWSDFQKPKKLDYDPESLTPNYGRFIAQPFERGFGTTIGNALRRVLLSSIEGAAITAIRVDGVLHEFSSLTGVVEDMTDVVLNLKQIPFKLHGEGPKTLYLEKRDPGSSPLPISIRIRMSRSSIRRRTSPRFPKRATSSW